MQRKHYEKKTEAKDASHLKVGIVVSRFNEDITGSMLVGALDTLAEWKVSEKNTFILPVSGSFELPLACQRLIKKHKLDAVIALGCIIKGETPHDVYIAHAVTDGLMRVSLDTNVPVGLGVITTLNLAQAKVRSRGKENKGTEAAVAVLETALS